MRNFLIGFVFGITFTAMLVFKMVELASGHGVDFILMPLTFIGLVGFGSVVLLMQDGEENA